MQPRTLDQIIAELNPIYQPSVDLYQRQQSLIPTQIAEQEKGLEAKKEVAFNDILGGARRRGLGFSGIPLSEQAKYTATDFLPALANLRKQGQDQAFSLQEAINSVNERKQSAALGMRQYEQQRYDAFLEQQRREEAERRARAAANSFSPTFGGGAKPAPTPTVSRKDDGGFAFTDTAGRPISAAVYAQQTGTPLGELLQNMAKQGDRYAAQMYNQIRANQGWFADPRNKAIISRMYSPIFWGI